MGWFLVPPQAASALKILLSIFPGIGLDFVSDNLSAFEGSSTGTQFSNWNSDYQNYRITTFITMMLLDFVFFFLLCWYLENVTLMSGVSSVRLVSALPESTGVLPESAPMGLN